MSNLVKSMVHLWDKWFNLYKEYYKYHSLSIIQNYGCILTGLGRLSLGYSPGNGITELQNSTHLTIENARLLPKMTVTIYTPESSAWGSSFSHASQHLVLYSNVVLCYSVV